MARQSVGELDYSLVRLNNLGQLDVSFALPLPTLHAPPPSGGAEEAGMPAELPPAAVLDAVAAALAAADVSYVCVPAPRAALRRQRPALRQRAQPYLRLTPPRGAQLSEPPAADAGAGGRLSAACRGAAAQRGGVRRHRCAPPPRRLPPSGTRALSDNAAAPLLSK